MIAKLMDAVVTGIIGAQTNRQIKLGNYSTDNDNDSGEILLEVVAEDGELQEWEILIRQR